jgi:hypothetical protein
MTVDEDYEISKKEVVDSIKLGAMMCTQRTFSELL